jgi:hypothetical protein
MFMSRSSGVLGPLCIVLAVYFMHPLGLIGALDCADANGGAVSDERAAPAVSQISTRAVVLEVEVRTWEALHEQEILLQKKDYRGRSKENPGPSLTA